MTATPVPTPPHESAERPAVVATQDTRLDKLATWALGAVFTLAVTVGGTWLSGIKTDIAELKKAVVDLTTASVRKESDRKDIDELKAKVLGVEARLLEIERKR